MGPGANVIKLFARNLRILVVSERLSLASLSNLAKSL